MLYFRKFRFATLSWASLLTFVLHSRSDDYDHYVNAKTVSRQTAVWWSDSDRICRPGLWGAMKRAPNGNMNSCGSYCGSYYESTSNRSFLHIVNDFLKSDLIGGFKKEKKSFHSFEFSQSLVRRYTGGSMLMNSLNSKWTHLRLLSTPAFVGNMLPVSTFFKSLFCKKKEYSFERHLFRASSESELQSLKFKVRSLQIDLFLVLIWNDLSYFSEPSGFTPQHSGQLVWQSPCKQQPQKCFPLTV